jgi:hypothetical protein
VNKIRRENMNKSQTKKSVNPLARLRLKTHCEMCGVIGLSHPYVNTGKCKVCGHYGEDCTGTKPSDK